jgi:hypothetical protein
MSGETGRVGGLRNTPTRAVSTDPAERVVGQVFQQVSNLDAVASDTSEIITELERKLGPILHALPPEDGAAGEEGLAKSIVPLASNLSSTYALAATNRIRLQSILKRIDL